MEQFIVSARKYRPQTFKDVVGQKAITNTLLNAIEHNHLAQALLFTGPRGVGKTTCARILARKINQEGYDDPDEDFSFNVFELDAASNNSVDDIRNIIDQVRIPPQTGKYKVYIVDEVHMLSQAAFNAFLKTLEEPPRHAIFILATTEKHKILPTILSRCQIFDFKRITINDAKEHLKEIATEQGVSFEDDALHIIAQKADGAMRDALSIFDRVVSYCGNNLTRQAVYENLNVLDFEYYIRVTDLILENKIPELLLAFDDILAKGFDGHHFIAGLASHFRDLLVCQTPSTLILLDSGEQAKALYSAQSQKASQDFLLKGIDLANTTDLNYKISQNQRLLVELCLMQLASITFDGEKKKPNTFIIPATHFRNNSYSITEVKSVGSVQSSIVSEQVAESSQQISVASVKSSVISAELEEKSVPLTEKTEQITENTTEIKQTVEPSEAKETSAIIPETLGQQLATKKPISALSLAGLRAKKELEAKQSQHLKHLGELPSEKFTETDMLLLWNKFAQRMSDTGKMLLSTYMLMNEPILDGTTITLELPNESTKEDFLSGCVELIGYLRGKLHNHDIVINVKVNETVEKKYAFTPDDKYERLRNINPAIDLLRKTFDLDV
ncbi:DNA polymerase III subunit gamma/tau [uncultured Flavobacterium sp.]|uniref:DNA polymerase III subunit gamma/tau n=1 Tax=uncultured Flavobacterium sp. TaxID=165435 RepID=UPI0030ED968C|tara:strand:- start:16193 stop:18037 length:1845 start_codon:yes stop_codon:yes gene_type:complete